MSTISDTPSAGELPLWVPKQGPEFNRYVNRLTPDHQARLASETSRILSTCVNPAESLSMSRSNAGLVLGYVQSGKTSSFTAATALAHDNGFNLVIIVGGTSKILLNQTFSRLQTDLDLDKPDAVNRWIKVLNPKLNTSPAANHVWNRLDQVATLLKTGQPLVGKKVALIVVMKEVTHLRNLNDFLASLSGPDKDGLRGISALIVDDECHMASPNVAAKDKRSRIYSLMGEMRSHLPHHTLLQYTATPQANLLCDLEDEFRSDFVRLLGHGPGYTGGRTLFFENPRGWRIRQIPSGERDQVMSLDSDSNNDKSIESLRHSLATFLIIGADNYLRNVKTASHDFENFSMLVHSHSTVNVHKIFQMWLSSLRSTWKQMIAGPPSNPDREMLLEKYFLPAYLDLSQKQTVPLQPLDELFGGPILHVLSTLQIWLIDGSKEGTREPDFLLSNYHILNGGEMLGVGFTIPRLHVTHMLRGKGQGQMDTIQQRGRFFGYCGDWVDQIRVWLEDDVKESFEGYVDEEEFLRQDLGPYDDGNISLKDWKVRLRLNPNARPTRRNAIRRDMRQYKTDNGWIRQHYWRADQLAKLTNRSLVENFLQSTGDFASLGIAPLEFVRAPVALRGTGRDGDTDHWIAASNLDALRRLLVKYDVESRDRAEFAALLEVLDETDRLMDSIPSDGLSPVDVYWMAYGKSHANPPSRRTRKREALDKVTLFQGSNRNYVGDSKVHSKDRISLQIHFIDHTGDDGSIDESDVVYFAVWLPAQHKEWLEGWLVEA
jgi:hypothetical protein